MHLIKSKSSAKFQSSSTLNFKNASQSQLNLQKFNKPLPRPQTTRPPITKHQSSKQNPQPEGIIARAISSAKSTIERLIPSSKLQTDPKIHMVGLKFMYHEDDLIGKGYSSNVYKGSSVDNQQTKNYAIKILDLMKIKGFLLDLLRKQISIHKKLDHPNIVKCFDVIQTQTHIYLILEYCSGGDLSHFINQRKSKLPEGQALSIMSQIAEGYKYLIRQKVLHRDLKPCNIFRCKMNDKWKIGDFGFSCWSYEQSDDVNVGTPIYMPPEALQKSKYSHKSDIFSLGVIMYEIIYGKVPWFSKSESLLVKKMEENKISFEGQKTTINSPLIKRFIERCCEVDLGLRMSEEEFVKLELYPKRPEEVKQFKNNFLAKTVGSFKAQGKKEELKLNRGSDGKREVQKEREKQRESQKTEQEKAMSKTMPQMMTKKALTQRVNNESCKTSQFSTQAQTRAIKDDLKGFVKQKQKQNQQQDTNPTASLLNNNSNVEQTYKKNGEILLKQNYFCKHLYFMIKNIEHFLLTEDSKQLLIIVLYKHILYILKKLKNTKFNYFQLKKWELYKLSKEYALFHKQVTVNFQRVESQFFKYPKKRNIKLLREVDSKFKEFEHDVEFNMKFYLKFIDYQKKLVHQFVGILNTKNFKQEKEEIESGSMVKGVKKEARNMSQTEEKQCLNAKTVEETQIMIDLKGSQQKDLSKQKISQLCQSKISSSIQIQALKLNPQQLSQSSLCQSVPHATLQSLLSLLQYYQFMNNKISNNQEGHTSYSLIDLIHSQEDQGEFSLIRDYQNSHFSLEDVKKITTLAGFL